MAENLDPTTKWKSNAEMTAARRERDDLGRNRYDFDAAHRSAWDAKCGLGSETDIVNVSGTVGPRNSVIATEEDWENARQVVKLRQEIPVLKAQLRAEEFAQLRAEESAQSRILGAEPPDPAKAPKPYDSTADMVADMRTPEYRNSEAVRKHVQARVAVSNFGDALRTTSFDKTNRSS